VSEAPQVRRLVRVGKVVYATAPSRITSSTRPRPGCSRHRARRAGGRGDAGAPAGACSRRCRARTRWRSWRRRTTRDRPHQFGDDAVGRPAPTTRPAALTPPAGAAPGRRDRGGAVYAFDPSRLASAQDRVRASMLGNPVSVLMAPDEAPATSRSRRRRDRAPRVVAVGAVRQLDRIPPARARAIELLRRNRRALVRCNAGGPSRCSTSTSGQSSSPSTRRRDRPAAPLPMRCAPFRPEMRARPTWHLADGEQRSSRCRLAARLAAHRPAAGGPARGRAWSLVDLKTYEVRSSRSTPSDPRAAGARRWGRARAVGQGEGRLGDR